MKKSKVSDPEKWPGAFNVLHFASPEDAAKAQALLYEMAAENVALRSKIKPERELQPCGCERFCKKLEGLPDGQFCMSLAAQGKEQFATQAAGHGPSVRFNVKEIAWLCNLYVALEKWRNTIFVDTNPVEPSHAEMAVVNTALRETWDRYKKETAHKSIGGIDTQWITEKIEELDL